MQSSPDAPSSYSRYIDDVFLVWLLGAERLRNFLDHFNNASPQSIRFTAETTEATGSINFMDTTLHVSATGRISYELFRKPCHSGLLCDFNSAVPHQQKLSIASSEFLRARRLSSDADCLARSERKVTDMLRYNNYPEDVIAEAKERVDQPRPRRPNRRNNNEDYRTALKLPFKTDAVHDKVQRLVRKYKLNIRLVYQNNNLKNKLCRSAYTAPVCRKFVDPSAKKKRGRPKAACVACAAGARQCTTSNVVYKLKCRECDNTYIGETSRSLATRANEHHCEARN